MTVARTAAGGPASRPSSFALPALKRTGSSWAAMMRSIARRGITGNRGTLARCELKLLAARLRHDFAVAAVYLFAFVRCEEHEGSDIDLVVSELPDWAFDRVGEVLRRAELPVEPVIMSRQRQPRRDPTTGGVPWFEVAAFREAVPQ